MLGHGPFFREIFIMKCSIIKIEESYGLSLLLGEANCCECDPIVVPKPRIGHGLNFEQINSEIPPTPQPSWSWGLLERVHLYDFYRSLHSRIWHLKVIKEWICDVTLNKMGCHCDIISLLLKSCCQRRTFENTS